MSVQILVPLTPRQSADELMPYFEVLTQPGSSVIFLISAKVNIFPWWLELLSLPSSDGDGRMPVSVLATSISLERKLELAKRRVAAVRRMLEIKGVAVAVECYNGRLQNAIRRLGQLEAQTVVLRISNRRVLRTWQRFLSFLAPRVECCERPPMTFSLHRA